MTDIVNELRDEERDQMAVDRGYVIHVHLAPGSGVQLPLHVGHRQTRNGIEALADNRRAVFRAEPMLHIQRLARLSRAFAAPDGTTFLRGEVAAILNWRRDDEDEEYNHLLRRDEWEVVLPELVFAAGAEAVSVDQKGS